MRAIVAAAVALGLGLAIAAVAWAAPALSIDSGPSGPTNDATPSFGFTAEAGAAVECSVDQGSPAYGPCTTETSHTAGPLDDGAYTFRVRATDAAEEQSVEERSFTVDTAAPSLSIDSGPEGPTNDAAPSFTFTAEAGATVECSVDQGSAAYEPCTSATSHTAGPLADGAWVFRVRATDAAGNSATVTQPFSVDTVAVLSIDAGPSGPTNDTTPSFGFTAEAGAAVDCSIDQAAPPYGPCTSQTTHDVGTPLSEGAHVFRVRAIDLVGNQTTLSRTFTVDTTPPSLSIGVGPSGPTNDATPSFSFTAGAGAAVECSVDDGSPAYGSCTSATSHTAASLADGAWVFHVRATDTAGNQTEAFRSFSVDTVAPTIGGISGPSGPTNDTTPSFTFAAESGATMECSVDKGPLAYVPCTTTTSHTAAPLTDGSYHFRVRATDAAGNRSLPAVQDFEVDSQAPSLSIDSGPSGPTNVTTPSFGFTAEPGTTVECSIDQELAPYGSCTTPATHVVGTPLAQGTHTFRVRAIDGVGNDAIQSRTFTVDTTPPLLSIAFGPSGPTSDSTPLFGFAVQGATTVECSIDQGTPAYGPCASATTDAAVAPLADGVYVLRVRAIDAAGNQAIVTREFTVDTVPQTGSPAPDPTPPVVPPVTPTPSGPRLLSPFPLVRIAGTVTPAGVRISRLSVRAPRGAIVRVTVSPACARKGRSSRRCHVLKAAGTVGASALIGFRGLRRSYRSGTVIVVRVWRADRIGKYTRFTIVRGKAPRRVDRCLVPGATHGSRCPSA